MTKISKKKKKLLWSIKASLQEKDSLLIESAYTF